MEKYRNRDVCKNQGFTLLEMVLVITLLGVLGSGIASLWQMTAQVYVDSAEHLRMSSAGRLAIARVTREVREALPRSVRVTSDGRCVEFVPIVTASTYLNLPTPTSPAQFDAVQFDYAPISGRDDYVVIYPETENDIYNTASTSSVRLQSVSAASAGIMQVNLANAHFFEAPGSPRQRFFIIAPPVSFCLVASDTSTADLYRYTDYGFMVNQPTSDTLGSGDLLLQSVLLEESGTSIPLFQYTPGGGTRNYVLTVDLRKSERDTVMRLHHQVLFRNLL